MPLVRMARGEAGRLGNRPMGWPLYITSVCSSLIWLRYCITRRNCTDTTTVILNSDASAQGRRWHTRAYLRPVTEDLAIPPVGDQLLGELEGER